MPWIIFPKIPIFLALALVTSLFNVVNSQSAVAAATATISGRNATLVSPSATTNLTGISVGGLAAGTTYLVAVGLSNAPAGASLKLPTYANLTVSYGYSAPAIYNSFTTVSFSGALADVNNALASLQYISGSQTGSPVLKISASSFNQNYSLNGYNGHYYSSSTTLGLTNASYTAARAAAKLQRYQGQPGYLVSITNSGENDFITNNIANAVSIWIGATDEVTEGQWRWDTSGGSPEAGLRFFNQTGASNCGRTGGSNYTADGLNYSSWASGEPNDYCSAGEDYAVTNWGGTGVNGGTWNDCGNDGCGAPRAYVIEFGTNDADGGFVNASSDFASNTFSLLYSSNAITTYIASTTTPTYGSAVTLTATVTSGATGTVAFKDASNNVLCTTGNLSSGTANCSWTPATRATYAVTAFYSGDGSYLASNSASANVAVTTRPITINAANKSASYSGSSVSVSNSYSITSGTLAGSDTFTALTYTFTSLALNYDSQTAPTNAATYTITPSAASFSVGSASNYSITYTTGTLTINKADSITVTASPSTTTYNASPITPAYLVSGLKGAETATVTSNFLGINGTSYSTSSTPPTNAGSYRYTLTDIVISAGASLNNYQGVIYESATVTINKAIQAAISVGQYDAYPGISTYPINVYGGSGTGAVTRSLTDSGTANCALASSMFLSASRVGTCTVRAVKASDTNYLSETATATIYWIQWSDAYATRVPSTPNEIVLQHQTQIIKYNYDTLTVTSYQNSSGVTITSIATGATLRIIGDGFSPTSAYTEVNFTGGRVQMDLTSGVQVINSGGSNYLQLVVPSGVSTGTIIVNSPKGTAEGPSLTIAP
jgi:hypothetical protein